MKPAFSYGFPAGFPMVYPNQMTSLQGLSPFPGDISMVKQAFLAPELPRQAQRWDVLGNLGAVAMERF